ncbi:nitroreductase [Lentzea sp. NPDC058450]|uniref:nitroreductase n=1 Tax=Lentzea sp. NPDC058450 TaxID=3346505 RepID=UPI003656D031
MSAGTSTSPALHEALDRLLVERWTCRQFLPAPVPRSTIEQVLTLAQRTPSWCNTQPWQVVITEGEGTERLRTRLLAHLRDNPGLPDFPFPAQYTGVYQERRRECGKQLYGSLGIERGDHEGAARQMMRNFALFDAPHVAIITTEADLGVYGAIDCGLYLNSFLLAAQSLGIATAPQAALAGYSGFLRDHFALPDSRRVVVGVSFGYPDTAHPANSFRTSRADAGSVATWHST